jgi:hypothetical protein
MATRTAPWSRRMLRLAGVAGILTLLAVGGTAIAFAQGDDPQSLVDPTTTTSTTGTSEPTTSTTSEPTTSTTSESTTSTTSEPTTSTTSEPTTSTTSDTVAPELELICLDVPDSFDVECTLTSTDAGTASIEPSWIPCGSQDVTFGESQTVELDPDRTFTLTRPELALLEFNVVASQSDAAGNTASSTAQLGWSC